MGALGADVEALEGLATAMTGAAETLRGTGRQITTAVGGALWIGPDAQRFRSRWRTTHVPGLQSVADQLDELARTVRRQAGDQRQASAAPVFAFAPLGAGGDGTPLPGLPGDVNRNGVTDWWERFVGPPSSPRYLHTGDGSEYIPQASEYDETRDQLLTTYYDEDGVDGPDIPGAALLSIQDRESGSEQVLVRLVGEDGTGGPAHAGGVATDGEYVYVTGENTVWVYERSALEGRAPGEAVEAYRTYEDVPATSFADIDDGRLYVGEYDPDDEGSLYSYRLGDDGQLITEPSRMRSWFGIDAPRYEGSTPEQAQGLEVVGDRYVFTQTHGTDDPTDLLVRDADGDDYDRIGRATPLSQGVNVVGDDLYVNSEGAADKFRDQLEEHGFDPPAGFEVIPRADTDLDCAARSRVVG